MHHTSQECLIICNNEKFKPWHVSHSFRGTLKSFTCPFTLSSNDKMPEASSHKRSKKCETIVILDSSRWDDLKKKKIQKKFNARKTTTTTAATTTTTTLWKTIGNHNLLSLVKDGYYYYYCYCYCYCYYYWKASSIEASKHQSIILRILCCHRTMIIINFN